MGGRPVLPPLKQVCKTGVSIEEACSVPAAEPHPPAPYPGCNKSVSPAAVSVSALPGEVRSCGRRWWLWSARTCPLFLFHNAAYPLCKEGFPFCPVGQQLQRMLPKIPVPGFQYLFPHQKAYSDNQHIFLRLSVVHI